MAKEVNSRIYEKTMMHHDFLHYRVGKGDVDTNFEIEFNEEEFSQHKDELIVMGRELRQKYLSQKRCTSCNRFNEWASRIYWTALVSIRTTAIISYANSVIP